MNKPLIGIGYCNKLLDSPALPNLTTKQLEALELRAFGNKLQEIADILGITLQGVQSRLYEAVNKLEGNLSESPTTHAAQNGEGA